MSLVRRSRTSTPRRQAALPGNGGGSIAAAVAGSGLIAGARPEAHEPGGMGTKGSGSIAGAAVGLGEARPEAHEPGRMGTKVSGSIAGAAVRRGPKRTNEEPP